MTPGGNLTGLSHQFNFGRTLDQPQFVQHMIKVYKFSWRMRT